MAATADGGLGHVHWKCTAALAATLMALAAPDVQIKLTAQGYNTIGICGDDFAAHVKRQHADYVRVAKDANIKVE